LTEVRVLSACELWTGAVDQYGYGRLSKSLAHRLAYEKAYGQIPPGYVVAHRCDTPLCVNPAHLWSCTQHENLCDMAAKGRARGQAATHCKNGHEYTPANTYWRPGKIAARDCRACIRARVESYQSRNGRPPRRKASA
jgi:hypothetical protein